MHLKGVFLNVSLAAAVWAQQPDPQQILVQLRQKVAREISRIPRYLCTETVHRQKTQLPSGVNRDVPCSELVPAFNEYAKTLQLMSADRLRLDVAVIDGHEIYSWVGEGRFGDQSLGQMVRVGLTANGSFGSFLKAIFVSDAATFTYNGPAQINGQNVLRYAFHVSLASSDYSLSNWRMVSVVPYSGSFLVDASTLDLLNVTIDARDIPTALNFCEVSNEMDYAKLSISGVNFLLPSQATTRVTSSNGQQSENRTVFSGCHEFTGESKLLFDDIPPTGPIVAAAKTKLPEIPGRVTFLISLAQKIDPATAAAGDVIKGTLAKPIKIPGSGVTIPKGTVLDGRICTLMMQYEQPAVLDFGVKWEALEFEGHTLPLHLSLTGIDLERGMHRQIFMQESEFDFFRPNDPTIGSLVFENIKRSYQIPAGFRTKWISF